MIPKSPKIDVTIEKGSSDSVIFCCGAMQGWRSAMQDEHICLVESLPGALSLFAVFDGHGGKAISGFVKKHYIEVLISLREFKEGQFEEALEISFKKMDEMMLSKQGQNQLNLERENKSNLHAGLLCGCTANVILISDNKIYTANSGDSRAAMRIGGIKTEYIELSIDHKPEDAVEMERIKKAGGYVTNSRVNGNLNLSRALGDFYYKKNDKLTYKEQLITCHPNVTQFNRPQQQTFILQGCDGIWELYDKSSAGLIELLYTDHQLGIPLSESITSLLNLLVSKNVIQTKGKGCDNMTATLIILKQKQ